jgi:hypothetical protein
VHELAAFVVGVGGAIDQASRFELVHANCRGWWVDLGGACDLSQGHWTVGELDQHLDLPGPQIEGDAEGTPAVLSADERGGYQHNGYGVLGRRPSFGCDPLVVSYCHTHDPICHRPSVRELLKYGLKQHEDYPSDGAAAAKLY